jgi:hypothetical protein
MDSMLGRQVRVCGMRTGIIIDLKSKDRARIEAVVADRLEAKAPAGKIVHVILDNDGAILSFTQVGNHLAYGGTK